MNKNTGIPFEVQTLNYLRALGYIVEPDKILGGNRIDIYMEETGSLGIPVRYAVACRDIHSPTGIDDVNDFAIISNLLRRNGDIDASMYISRFGFTKEAQKSAGTLGIKTLSYENLEHLFNHYPGEHIGSKMAIRAQIKEMFRIATMLGMLPGMKDVITRGTAAEQSDLESQFNHTISQLQKELTRHGLKINIAPLFDRQNYREQFLPEIVDVAREQLSRKRHFQSLLFFDLGVDLQRILSALQYSILSINEKTRSPQKQKNLASYAAQIDTGKQAISILLDFIWLPSDLTSQTHALCAKLDKAKLRTRKSIDRLIKMAQELRSKISQFVNRETRISVRKS